MKTAFLITVLLVPLAASADDTVTPAPPVETAPVMESARPAPEMEDGDDIPNWKARWELARVLRYSRRFDESEKEYKALLKEKPDLLPAKVELALVLFSMEKKDEAYALAETVSADDADAQTRLSLCDLYSSRKEYGRAEAICRAMLKDDPEDQAARLKLAQVLSWAKKYDESLAEYRLLLAKRPDDVQLRRRFAYVLIWAGKNDEGAEELKKTLESAGSAKAEQPAPDIKKAP